MSKTKSARGFEVDFDLLKIKEQIASAPPPQTVQARKDFIDRKLRRHVKKAQANIVEVDQTLPEPQGEEEVKIIDIPDETPEDDVVEPVAKTPVKKPAAKKPPIKKSRAASKR